MVPIGGRPLLDIWLDALAERASTRCWSTSTTSPRRWPQHVDGARRPAGRAALVRARAARQRRHARRQPEVGRRRRSSSWPATPTTSPTSTSGRSSTLITRPVGVGDADRVPLPTDPSDGRDRRSRRRRHGRRASRRSRADRGRDLANAGIYAFDPERARRARRAATPRHRLRPAAAAGRPGASACRSTATSATSGPSTRTASALEEWPAVAAMIITQTPLRIGLLGGGTDLPELLPGARRPGPQLRDRQVRLRDRQAALRRRHLRQLLQEGDRLARRRTSSTSSSARRCR